MSFEECRCIVPTCNGCETECWDGETSPPHFSIINARVAREVLAAQHGWEIAKQDDGTYLMLCPRCSRRSKCDNDGHQWYAPALEHVVPGVRPVEMCEHCGIVRRDYEPLNAPPARHPESMDAVLSDEDEALLAAYDHELFPEEAI